MESSTYYFFHLLFISINALLAMRFLWSCASAQEPGFLSIDCGSNATAVYTDANGIEWVSDMDFMNEGTPTSVSDATDPWLSRMRLFDGNQSKYCYSLSNSGAVHAGDFFLVRAVFWAGITPPYVPQSSDGLFRFKLIVDTDQIMNDVEIPYGSSIWYYSEAYVRAQRSSIDVCLARSSPGGDAPFISALELRPLPPSLTSTSLINDADDPILISFGHYAFGVSALGPNFTRYAWDSLDRVWFSLKSSDSNNIQTEVAIDVSAQVDELPGRILQAAYTNVAGFTWSFSDLEKSHSTIGANFPELDPNNKYLVEFYFAEIEPAVNASGLRAFDVSANGVPLNTNGPIDVFATVGANKAYAFSKGVSPNATGDLVFNFTATTGSTFPPFLAAAEFFNIKPRTPLTNTITVNALEEMKIVLNLGSFVGDPCLPVGYGYSWLNCSKSSEITSLLLSKHNTGGQIPTAINSLTTLIKVHLDGNGLNGEIPDLSALTNLQLLDLRNNNLSGSIPNFLGALKNLKFLYLQNNTLSGLIPADLLQRKRSLELTFEFSGNSALCENATEANCQSKKKSSTGIIVGATVAAILLVSFATAIAVYRHFRRTKGPSTMRYLGGPRMHKSPNPGIKLSVQEFSFQEIRDATDNFRTRLGQGGFGPVYKGCLPDRRLVAIKVAYDFSHQGPKEFFNEVDFLSRVHHKNLVALLGYCNEEKLVLVYEFLSNGSLFDCLHGPSSKAFPLSWATRLRILVDAAEGLEYLHRACNPPIIHRDIKSSNILLNDKMEAKISDFGISRNNMMGGTESLITPLMGTMGYIDPEYFAGMKLTEKVDVYSFGVLVFEVICGQTAMLQDSSSSLHRNLVDWAKASIDRGAVNDILDLSLHGQYDIQSVLRVMEVALACVEDQSCKRPKMSDVYLELREAERMELESDERIALDKPSLEFIGGNNYGTLSDIQVSAR